MNSDRIEKKIFLKAPRERVWRAISDPSHYGAWFGVQIDGPFVAGKLAELCQLRQTRKLLGCRSRIAVCPGTSWLTGWSR